MIPAPLIRIAVAACTAATLAACAVEDTPPAGPSPTPVPWTGAVLVKPLPKPAFTLTTTDGRPYDFQKETAGKVALLYFGYTHCPDACPTAMASLALAQRSLSDTARKNVVTVFVTTDPARDTPAVLKAWLMQFDPTFVGLTGPADAINRAETITALPVATVAPIDGAPPGTYGVNHAAVVVVFTPDGYAHVEWPDGVQSADVARDLQRLVTSGFS
jgi:protein SCO1